MINQLKEKDTQDQTSICRANDDVYGHYVSFITDAVEDVVANRVSDDTEERDTILRLAHRPIERDVFMSKLESLTPEVRLAFEAMLRTGYFNEFKRRYARLTKAYGLE